MSAQMAPAGVPIWENDPKQVLELYRAIRRSGAKLVGRDGRTQDLPLTLYQFLVKLMADLVEGQSVAIIQDDAQLTTVEAARMLGVSRQFLIKLLQRGEIPCYMVGTHRRIYFRDVLVYKAKRDGKRRQILDELTRAEAEEGLYDREPPDDRAG